MEKKNYRQFDWEAAKAGRPVMTRIGDRVEIVSFEMHHPSYPIAAIITQRETGLQAVGCFTLDGKAFDTGEESPGDLVMAPLEFSDTFWVNLYLERDSRVMAGNGVFSTEEKAKEESCLAAFGLNYLDTVAVKVEWHEGEPQPRTAAGE